VRIRSLLLALVLAMAAARSIAAEPALRPPADRKILVAFVVTQDATLIDFAGPWEVFQDAFVRERGQQMADQMPFELVVVGASRAPIQLMSTMSRPGMTLVPDYSFAAAPVPDVVVVGAQPSSPELLAWLRAMRGKVSAILGTCTGNYLLAEAGLLDGKAATTHAGYYDDFATKYPRVLLRRDVPWVRADDVVFTAGGGGITGIDLALHIVELYFGRPVARQVGEYLWYGRTGWK
jgi:transcriptional regulator GlxA family with amidase domain